MKHDTMYTDLSHDKPNHDIYKSPYMVVTLNLPYAYIKNKIHIYKRGRSRVTRYSILQSYILCREVFLNE